VVMAEGRHLAEGTFAEVAALPQVQEAYMGRRLPAAGATR
jgi:ABC-type branched-subunit amino acid transport system ATPase component